MILLDYLCDEYKNVAFRIFTISVSFFLFGFPTRDFLTQAGTTFLLSINYVLSVAFNTD